MAQKLTTAAFIEKARAVHGDTYDYSRVEYVAAHQKIAITCPEHGVFEQKPVSHTSLGNGCPACAGNARRTVADFIKDAKAIHGDKYDYSGVITAKVSARVSIMCPVHGEFKKQVNNHLHGREGCPYCSNAKISQAMRSTAADFIKKAKLLHGDKYDYSAVAYEASSQDVLIKCFEHGIFQQKPNKHLSGHGCPTCSKRNGWSRSDWIKVQKGRKATLYVLELSCDAEVFYKIGITYDLRKRYQRHPMAYSWRTIALYKSYNPASVYDLEKQLHREFAYLRYHPKHSFPGQTESYSSVVAILATLPAETFFLRNRPVT